MSSKQNISRGITLSAPAILTKREFTETLLNEEILKKKFLKKKPRFKSQRLHQSNPSIEKINISPKNIHLNLPEFIDFQSEHILISQLINDRLRPSSTFQTSKFTRQSNLPQTTNISTMTSPTKRLSRSRHSYDTSLYYEKQQKYPLRASMNKFDSMLCFNEVRRD